MMRFFIGENEIEVKPQYSKTNSAAHYAWCLETVIKQFSEADSTTKIRDALVDFKKNMLSSPATLEMFKQIENDFNFILHSNDRMDKDHLIQSLSKILDLNNGYMEIRYPKP